MINKGQHLPTSSGPDPPSISVGEGPDPPSISVGEGPASQLHRRACQYYNVWRLGGHTQ